MPCFRLRGHYFVIATLVVAVSVFQVFTVWDWVGGAIGLEIPVGAMAGSTPVPSRQDAVLLHRVDMLALVTAGRGGSGDRVLVSCRGLSDDETAAPARALAQATSRSPWRQCGDPGCGGGVPCPVRLFVDPFSVLGLHISILVALFAILGGVGTPDGADPRGGVLVPLSEYSRIASPAAGATSTC